jgi:hypothetical protein
VVLDVPEGGIAPGSPGAKEAVFAEWANHPGWQQGDQWLDTLRLVNGESSWDESAANPASTAEGLFQFLDTTRAQYGYGPTAKEQAGPGGRYILERYGSPSEAWAFWSAQSPHWYADGGPVIGPGGPRDDRIPAFLSNGEYVVNAMAARDNMPLLESINARRPMPTMSRPRASAGSVGYRDHVEYHVRTATVEDAFLTARRNEERRMAAQMAGL